MRKSASELLACRAYLFNHASTTAEIKFLQTIGLYSSSEDKILNTFSHSAPVLDAAVEDDGAIISAGLDGKIKR